MKRYKTSTKETKEVVGEYNGFAIYRVTIQGREWDYFHRCYTDKITHTDVYYTFAKGVGKPLYDCYRCTVDSLCEAIDEFINGTTCFLTKAERRKYIAKPNEECEWGFSKKDCQKFLEEHKKGNIKTQYIIEERLEDANFHTFCGLLCAKDYNGAEECLRNW